MEQNMSFFVFFGAKDRETAQEVAAYVQCNAG